MASNTEPLVCCVMLTADRQELTERAVRCFQAQTYQRKWLLIYDTGEHQFELAGWVALAKYAFGNVLIVRDAAAGRTIGALRNAANALMDKSDIIAHFDSDDISLPNRLEEQVKFLLETEAHDAIVLGGAAPPFCGVAYRKLPFWNRHRTTVRVDGGEREVVAQPGAWMFNCTFPYPGATFMYHRSLWERHPFPDRQTGEDTWWSGRNFLRALPGVAPMLCEIHGGNTSSHGRPDLPEWTRHPALDAQYRKILEEA